METAGKRKKEYVMRNRFTVLACAAIILAMAGCAAPVRKKELTVFFPPAPELPRVQYLASFTRQKDIETQSAFDKFIKGDTARTRLNKPYGVGIYDGKIYVCDTNTTVMVFDFNEKKYYPLDGARGQGKLMQPQNIYIDKDGTKYVADPVRGQVVVFDRNDQYVRAYGLPGKWKPVDAVTYGDELYVVDTENGMVKVFDKKTGEIIRTIGNKGDASEKLYRPTNAAFDEEGNIYVSDFIRFQIVEFDRDGHFLKAFGRAGDSVGSFSRPRGIFVDKNGYLFAVDAAFNNVQIFNKEGRLLMFFGNMANAYERGALVLPAQVVVDTDNLKYFQQYVDPSFEAEELIIVTSQFGDRMVSLYALGKEKGVKYPTDEEILEKLKEERKEELEKLKKAEKKGDEKAGEAGNTERPAEAPAGK
jgi:DNA-binding beta-propeller fold protein YncE